MTNKQLGDAAERAVGEHFGIMKHRTGSYDKWAPHDFTVEQLSGCINVEVKAGNGYIRNFRDHFDLHSVNVTIGEPQRVQNVTLKDELADMIIYCHESKIYVYVRMIEGRPMKDLEDAGLEVLKAWTDAKNAKEGVVVAAENFQNNKIVVSKAVAKSKKFGKLPSKSSTHMMGYGSVKARPVAAKAPNPQEATQGTPLSKSGQDALEFLLGLK